MKTNKQNNHSTYKVLRFFLPYYRPYIGVIILDLVCALLTTVCELVFPMIIRYITNTALSGEATLVMSTILRIGGIYMFLRLVDTFANYYMAYIGHVMGVRLETDMRRDLFSHLQKLSFKFYDNTKVGTLMSRITTDLFDITEFSHHCPEEFFIATVKIVGSFIILARLNLWLTLSIFLILPFMFVAVKFCRKDMKMAFGEQRVQTGELNAQLEDSLLGIRVVKSFANESLEEKKFKTGNERFYDIKKAAYKYMARFQFATRFFDGLMYVLVVVMGSVFMVNKKITSADLIAFLLYIQTLLASIRKIVDYTEQFQKGLTGIERFYEIMKEEPEIKDLPGATDLENVKGNISINNVSFSYENEGEQVLANISIDIKAGENIAIVGPSGGGKTTLCNLIPRFYEITGGSILIDGTDIKTVKLESLRNNIGMVQQDVYMFCGTVRDNISYGLPNATQEQIENAAKLAGAHSFIEQLSDGYDTYIGERGVKLSGGQKQRLSIARLFLKNPPILILDEATSALDNESEFVVQKSLEKLAKGRTTLTIAHRLTTIKNADRIIVLTKDGISETGTHAELIKKDGEYKKMYSMYTG